MSNHKPFTFEDWILMFTQETDQTKQRKEYADYLKHFREIENEKKNNVA